MPNAVYWPSHQDYQDAVQDPGFSFADAKLAESQTPLDKNGIPKPYSGGFGVVYELQHPQTKQRWAVKCFTGLIEGRQNRFQQISQRLKQVKHPFFVDFEYQPEGISIQNNLYPIVKMEWVEGTLLNDFVSQSLTNPKRLKGLIEILLRVSEELEKAGIAHCDLQHGNIMLVQLNASTLRVKLVDYDGMYTPELAREGCAEIGHPAYQHPKRMVHKDYGIPVDRFSMLVILTAINALANSSDPNQLWSKYYNQENLLFRKEDLADPTNSAIFQEFKQHPDAAVRYLINQLEQACTGPLGNLPSVNAIWANLPSTAKTIPPTTTVTIATSPSVVTQPAKKPWLAIAIIALLMISAGIGAFVVLNRPTPSSPTEIVQAPTNSSDEKTEEKEKEAGTKQNSKLDIERTNGTNPGITKKDDPFIENKEDPKNETLVDIKNVPTLKLLVKDETVKEIRDSQNRTWKIESELPTLDKLNSMEGLRISTPEMGICRLQRLNEAIYLRKLVSPKPPMSKSCCDDLKANTLADTEKAWFQTDSSFPSEVVAVWGSPPFRLFDQPSAIAYSPDGSILAVATMEDVFLVDWAKNQLLRRLAEKQVKALAFSANGSHFAAGKSDGQIRVWECKNWQRLNTETAKLDKEEVRVLAFRPDGGRLAVGGRNGSIRVWNIPGLKEAADFREHKTAVDSLTFNDEQGSILISASVDQLLVIWNANTKEIRYSKTIEPNTQVGSVCVALSPNNEYLAYGTDKNLRVWKMPMILAGKGIYAVANLIVPAGGYLQFTPDGKELLVAGNNFESDYAAVISKVEPREVVKKDSTISLGYQKGYMFYSGWPKQNKLAFAHFSNDSFQLKIMDLTNNKSVWQTQKKTFQPFDVSFSPDGKRVGLLRNNQVIHIWNLTTRKMLNNSKNDLQAVATQNPSLDGVFRLHSPSDGVMEVQEVETNKEVRRWTISGNANKIIASRFSPDGDRVLAISEDGRLHIWSLHDERLLKSISIAPGVVDAVYRSDGFIAVATKQGAVHLINPNEPNRIRHKKYNLNPKGQLHTLTFSPDERHVAIATTDENIILLRLSPDRLELFDMEDLR